MRFRPGHDRVEELTTVQRDCKRVRNTPTPFAYSRLLHRTSRIFCLISSFGLWKACGLSTPIFRLVLAYAFLGLDALGDQIREPFGLLPIDLPLDALAGIVKIDLSHAAGLRAEAARSPLRPVDGRLT